MKQKLIAFALAGLLAGCATGPTVEEFNSANFGIKPANPEKIIGAGLDNILKDPQSARIKYVRGPEKAWTNVRGPLIYGYGVCAQVNAKNSYGGYTGNRLHFFMIRNNVLVRHVSERGGEYDIEGQTTRDICSTLRAYTPPQKPKVNKNGGGIDIGG